MSNDLPAAPAASLTPCTGICRLDPHGYCIGCRRSGEEIARWRSMDERERLHYLREVLPERWTR